MSSLSSVVQVEGRKADVSYYYRWRLSLLLYYCKISNKEILFHITVSEQNELLYWWSLSTHTLGQPSC